MMEPDEIDAMFAATGATRAMFIVQAITDNAPDEVEFDVPLYMGHYLCVDDDGSNSGTAPLEISEEAEAEKCAWRERIRACYFS